MGMFIMDFEDTVTLVSPSGERHAAALKGLVEPDNPGMAGLGHSLLGLADQSWREITVRTTEALDFKAGQVVFRDGSRRGVELTLKGREGPQHVYGVALLGRQR